MSNKFLIVQFSGGETSGFLRHFLGVHFPDRPIITLFENTGKELPETLEFVHRCDREFDWRVIWLEAVVHPDERKATTHKVVDFECASRNGEPFEAVIAKYGLPNMVYKHCTRELKINPKNSYIKSLGLKEGDYETAIGIRADEQHRLSKDKKRKIEEGIIYPFIDLYPVNKKMVNLFWERQPFRLEIDSAEGNCDLCFKKSIPTLVNLVREKPEKAIWWERIGNKYSTTGGGAMLEPRKIFRGYRTAEDLLDLAAEPTLLNSIDEMDFDVDYDCLCSNT